MEQIITGDVWKEANSFLDKKLKRTAAIAYVAKPTLHLSKGDTLLCDASDHSIESSQTTAQALKDYFDNGVSIYSISNLHAKFAFNKNTLICGSANQSFNSSNNLIECAIITQNITSISQAAAFVYGLIEKIQPLTSEEIKRLLKIPVKRSFGLNRNTGRKKFTVGHQYWIMRTHPLSERIDEVEKKDYQEIEQEIAVELGLKDSINNIRLVGSSKIRREIKGGEPLIQITNNGSSRQLRVCEPVSVIKVQHTKKWTRVYYIDSDEVKSISWTEFRKRTSNIKLGRKISKTTTRALLFAEFQALSKLWGE